MKEYTVYLFRAPDCKRGWLAYIDLTITDGNYDLRMKVVAKNGNQAKEKAITMIRNFLK